MKKLILNTAAIFIFTIVVLNCNAQNSLNLSWGHFMPANTKLNKAFSNSYGFSIGFLHPINKSDFSVGLTLSHQEFRSKDEYFRDDYESALHIHNYLISARYEMINHTEFKLYASTDAGLNKSISKELQVGSKKEYQNTGITAGISFGAEFVISRRTLLGANIQSQYSYIQPMHFDDKLVMDNATNIAANIGIRFLLGKKR